MVRLLCPCFTEEVKSLTKSTQPSGGGARIYSPIWQSPMHTGWERGSLGRQREAVVQERLFGGKMKNLF